MADITAEWVIGIEDATGGHPYGPGGSNHTGQALLNINSTWSIWVLIIVRGEALENNMEIGGILR